jgi:hypothetical protein
MPKTKQLSFLRKTKKGTVKPDKRVKYVRENAERMKAEKTAEKARKKEETRRTKIDAYNLAWQVIDGKIQTNHELVQEAWWIVKQMGPAKGQNKIGRRATFRRIRGATIENPGDLELNKILTRMARNFITAIRDKEQR